MIGYGLISAFLMGIPAFSALAEDGVTPSELFIGVVNQQTSSIAASGLSLTAGLKAGFERINRSGGIHGRKLTMKVYDDAYEPGKTVEMTKKLMEDDKVFLLTGYNATAPIKAVFSMISKSSVPFLFPRTGDKFLRETSHKYIFNFRASFEDEIDRLIIHADERGMKRYAILYQPDALGDAVRSAAVAALSRLTKNNNQPFVSDGTVPRESKNAADYDAAFKKIEQGNPDAIILACSSGTALQVIKRAIEKNKNWAYFASNNTNALNEMLGELNPDLTFAQVFPNYEGSEAFAVQFREDMKKINSEKDINYISFEGYIDARIIADAVQAAGPAITRETFVTALEGLNWKAMDLELKWTPSAHNLRGKVFLTKRKGKKLVSI